MSHFIKETDWLEKMVTEYVMFHRGKIRKDEIFAASQVNGFEKRRLS